MRRPHRTDAGFTLVELLVVVVIIGILIAIAIPVYLNYTRSAKDKSAQSDLRGAISVLETCYSQDGVYPAADAVWAANTAVCTTNNPQRITVSAGTTLTYRAVGSGTSYLLFGTNSGGKPAYYCYSNSTGGSVQTRTVSTTTACP